MKLPRFCFPFLATATVAFSQTFTWTGVTDGNWNTATNWTTGVPTSSATTTLVFDNASSSTASNNIPGGLTLNALTIGAGSGARLFNGNLLTFTGATPTFARQNTSGNIELRNPLHLDSSLHFAGSFTFSAQTVVSGNISGVGGIVADEGVCSLFGNNSYTGATVIRDNALLAVSGAGIASTSGVSVETGGELQLLKNTSINRPISLSGALSGSGTVSPAFGGFLPSISSSGTITLTGAAVISALASPSFQPEDEVQFPVFGQILLSGNTLQLSTAGANNTLNVRGDISGIGSLNIVPSDGKMTLGNVNVDGTVTTQGTAGNEVTMETLAGNGNLSVGRSLTINGAVSGNRNISTFNDSLITGVFFALKSNLNSFIGSIDIGARSYLLAKNESSLGAIGNPLTFDGGVLKFTSSGNLSRTTITTTGVGFFSSPGFSGTVSSNIVGPGGFGFLNFNNNAIYTLTGTNTFEGGLGIGGGAIILFSQDTNLGVAGGPLIFSGGSLNLPANYTTLARPIEISGGLLGGSEGITYEVTSDISGDGRFRFAGGATFVLKGSNSFTGQLAVIGENTSSPTTLSVSDVSKLGAPTATLQLGEQSGPFIRLVTLRATGNLNMEATRTTTFRAATIDTNGFDVTINQPFSGRGLHKTGAGILRLNTVNPDSSDENAITIDEGILRLGINQAFGTRARIASMTNDAVLDLNGFSAEFEAVGNVADTAEIRLGTGALTIIIAANISGSITGPGSVVIGKSGFTAFQSTFSGVNTFSGGLTIANGAHLDIRNPASLGASGNSITIDNGTLSVGTLLPSPLVIDSSTNLTIGSGGARFSAGGQSIVIERQLTGTNPIRFGGGNDVFETEIYDVRLVNPTNDFTGPIQIGEASFEVSQSQIVGIIANGSLGNPSNVITLGASFFDGESTHDYSGGLRAYADLTVPASRAIRIEGEGAVIDSNGHVFTITTPISELSPEKTLLKNGGGALILDSANTYTGETFVRQGTLGGNGSIAGSLRFNSNTTLAPGSPSAIGTFTCMNFDMTSGGTYVVNLTSGAGSDSLVVNGDASISESTTLLIQPTGTVTQGDVFIILQKTGLSPVSGTFEQTGTFTSGGVEWSINYSGGDGNDIAITALTGSTAITTSPVLSNLSITPAGSSSLSSISATISGGPADTTIFLEASSDLGQLDPWETIKSILLDANGAATISNATDPNSTALPRNFFRLRLSE